jgi:hypothetical protein
MSELGATTDVVTLADHVDGLGESVARRLDDHGVETVADILIADEGALTDVPYVSETRAALLRETADAIVDVEPREVDFDATESVVSEAAIPLSVRRGEAVLAPSGSTGTNGVYHTTDCSVVQGKGEHLRERDRSWAENRDLEECGACSDPGVHGDGAERNESDLEPLVDPAEVVLEATLGEKLQITLADRNGWVNPRTVIEAPEATEWESATGGTWHTRRLRLSESASGRDGAREFDLVLVGDEICVEDPPVKHVSHQPDAPGWGVESVGAVGRVSTASLIQLQTDDEETDAKPEGDDSWRQYQQRGETA